MQYEDNSKNVGHSTKRLLLGRLMLGGMTAAMLATSSLAAHATNINLAVASNFYGTSYGLGTSAIYEVIQAFQSAHSGYTVTVVDNGATAALAGRIVAGNTSHVDLLMAADVATPWALYNGVYPTTSTAPAVSTWVTGAPFDYAIGYLAFLSGTTTYNVTCGSGGSCGFDPDAGYTSVAIAQPTQAPYGLATQEYLWNAFEIDLASPPFTVHYYTNITGPYNAVAVTHTDPVGFVALSAICLNGVYPTAGTSAAGVDPSDVRISPISANYKPLTQGAVKIAIGTTRGVGENAELDAFVAFIQDFTVNVTATGPADSAMIGVLNKYCYSAPHQ